MNFESGRTNNRPERNPERFDGKEYEKFFVQTIDCGWDADKYIQYRQDGKNEDAKKLVNTWISEQIMPVEQWRALSDDDQREKMMDWVEQHQPEGWNPKDPPIREDIEGDLVPKTFLQDLHFAVTEGIASEFIALQQKQQEGKKFARGESVSDDEISAYLDKQDLLSFLGIYTAADTPADTLFGTDLFFDFEFADSATGEPHNIRYPIDITMNPRKISGEKSMKTHVDYPLFFTLVGPDGRKLKKISAQEITQKGREIGRFIVKKIISEDERRHAFQAA